MILNGSHRGGGLKLAAHLNNQIENDHVELHDIRGFVSANLKDALQEAEAVAKGTQCAQYLFSLSLNPPETEKISISNFEEAVEAAEQKLGLEGQPRAIVFHEKNGRRHAHAVWSRVDAKSMKAINLPFYHQRLTELSKDLFLQHEWRLPDGPRDRCNRDPRNFDLTEWQQAKRRERMPARSNVCFKKPGRSRTQARPSPPPWRRKATSSRSAIGAGSWLWMPWARSMRSQNGQARRPTMFAPNSAIRDSFGQSPRAKRI